VIPPFLLANWRILAVIGVLLVAGAAVGVSRLQLANCRAALAETRAAHDRLLGVVQQQNAAVERMEREAKDVAAKARRAREAAAATIRTAEGKAKGLETIMATPRAPSECPAGDAVRVIRADLAGR